MRVDLLDDDRVGKDTGSMKTFSVDLTRLPSSGHGTVRIPTDGLCIGDKIGVFDEDTATFEATVLAILSDRAEIQVQWDRVLHLT